MAQKLTASMPDGLDLTSGWIVQLTAISPTTGALVSGVNVSNVAIVGDNIVPTTADDGGGSLPSPAAFQLIPIDTLNGG